jgi:peptidoglycan/LPS O-acetylase OafA/YrhL
MNDQSLPSNGGTALHDRHIPALDGLRFVAAFLVAGGHYMRFEGGAPLSETIDLLTGLGMTLFFVLSGFVIHYNYNTTIVRPGGVRAFFVARFTRLYPLYIVLFLFDFAYTGLTHHSACGLAGTPGEHWSGLIFYLTLTQSWLYAVICQASLAYQYGPVSAVTWSISVEFFFYLVYIAVALLIARRRWSPRTVVGIAVAAYALTLVYFWVCGHYQDDIDRVGVAMFGPAASTASGYDNSLLRWLFYFNPLARLAEFFAGLAAAQLYLAPSPRASTLKPASPSGYTLIAILAAVLVHLWLYGMIAPTNGLVGRIASPLYGPLVAIMLFCIARYDTRWSRLLAMTLPVQLGESSYSIYMLHEIIPSAFKRLGLTTTDVAAAWVTWVGALVLLALISRASYALFERPARQLLRALLAPKVVAPKVMVPKVTAPGS